ncbi:MAG: DUF507 family protein [Hydrogenothermaceae bacterium]
MKLPAKLVERVVDSLTKELIERHLVEPENPQEFRDKINAILQEAIEEERQLEEEAERLVSQHIHLIESEDIRYRTAVMKVKEKLAEDKNIHLEPEERINQIANKIKKYIELDPSIEIFEHPNYIRRVIVEKLKSMIREEKEIDKEVRQRIKSYSKKIVEGTPEWRILYNRIYEDALKRRGLL